MWQELKDNLMAIVLVSGMCYALGWRFGLGVGCAIGLNAFFLSIIRRNK